MHHFSGLSPHPAGPPPSPSLPSRSRRVPPEGAARAPPSPSWRAHQPQPLARRRRRRLLLSGLRPLPHRACAAQAPPPPSPFNQQTASPRGGRGGVTRLRAAGRFKGAEGGKTQYHVIPRRHASPRCIAAQATPPHYCHGNSRARPQAPFRSEGIWGKRDGTGSALELLMCLKKRKN